MQDFLPHIQRMDLEMVQGINREIDSHMATVHFNLLAAHQRYDYKSLEKEFTFIQRENDEIIESFKSRILKTYYRFHDHDQIVEEEFNMIYAYLIKTSFSEEELI